MIQEKIIIQTLTDNYVDVVFQKFYVDENNTSTQLGQNHSKGYGNTESGRLELVELSQNVQDSILAIWGTNPTVTENTIL